MKAIIEFLANLNWDAFYLYVYETVIPGIYKIVSGFWSGK